MTHLPVHEDISRGEGLELLSALLDSYAQKFPAEQSVVDQMQALIANPADPFARGTMAPGHFTASVWLIDPTEDTVLLTHHVFLDKWLQLGGHIEQEGDIRLAALREASEESGLRTSDIDTGDGQIFDLDIHPIPASPAKSEGPHKHFDIRFLMYASSKMPLLISDESHDLKWVNLDMVPTLSREPGMLRMTEKYLLQEKAQ